MKKKLVIISIILAIIGTLVTMYITSIAATHEIGYSKYIGMASPWFYAPNWGFEGEEVNLQSWKGMNHFCVNQGTSFQNNPDKDGDYDIPVKHYNVARAEIVGNIVNIVAGVTVGGAENVKANEFVEDGITSKLITLLYYKMNQDRYAELTEPWGTGTGTKTVLDENGNPIVEPGQDDKNDVTIKNDVKISMDANKKYTVVENTGESRSFNRLRGRLHYYTDEDTGKEKRTWYIGSLQYDVGQCAMWRAMFDWRNNVATNITFENQENLWQSLLGALQTYETFNEYPGNYTLSLAYERGRQFYKETIEEVNNSVDNDYGIEETYYNDSSTEKVPETSQEEENFTIIGPFRYKFGGTLQNDKPTLTFDEDTTEQEYIIGKYEGSTFTETNEIVSEQSFYIKVETSLLENVEYIHFDFQVEGISLANTETTLYFYVRAGEIEDATGNEGTENEGNEGEETETEIEAGTEDQAKKAMQTIMEVEQNLVYNKAFKDTYKLNQTVYITLTKTSKDRNALKAVALKEAGIKFQIKDETNSVVAYLETDDTGNAVVTDSEGNPTGESTVKLYANQTYTIIETLNNLYGYKGRVISDAKLVNGNGAITLLTGGRLEVILTDDDEIEIQNSPQLGDLTIVKKGTNGENLSNVEFVIMRGNNEYLKLNEESVTTPIVTTDEGIDFSEYNITTVATAEEATKFRTNESGEIILNNLEIYKAVNRKYTYIICETVNDIYGYKARIISSVKLVEGNGRIIGVRDSQVEMELSENNVLEIENSLELGRVTIVKSGENNERLSNVEFVLMRGNEYIRLREAPLIIVANYGINFSKYTIDTVDTVEQATKFRTNQSGLIVLNNLEIYEGVNPTTQTPIKYMYKLCETKNSNYGYKGMTFNAEGINFVIPETEVITVANKSELGSLQLHKHLEGNENIKLEDVEFAIEISPSENGNYSYLALYNNEGKIVKDVKGTVKINANNKATADGTEYEVHYYDTDKAISELTADEKEELFKNITMFKTDADGTFTVNNLEVYASKTQEKYTYKLVEVNNPTYGFEADSVELGNIQLETDKTISAVLTNEQKYTKISGYVWRENTSGKSNEYDKVYTGENKDQLLKDLYKMTSAGLAKNENANIPVEIKLRNKVSGVIIKSQPDEFNNETGEYVFNEIEIENISSYDVVFEYNGFTYTTIKSNLEDDNGSKAEENKRERKEVNALFGKVQENGEIVSIDGETTNKVEYIKDGHTSTVSNLNIIMSASTANAGYNFGELINQETITIIESISNVNMGLVLREQPKTRLDSDIYHVYIEVNGKKYTYEYNTRTQHFENVNNDEVGVKFEQENNTSRYTQPVYSSDVKALEAGTASMSVSIVYKITLSNKSNTLTTVVKEIANYYDKEYTIEAISSSITDIEQGTTTDYTVTETKNVEGAGEAYNCAIISLGNGIELTSKESEDIYIKFSVSERAIRKLLEGKSTYHNATEIMSYLTLYGERTGKAFNENTQQYEYFVSDNTRTREVYAGIDKESQPGNIELVLIDHPEGGTKILDNQNFENDTSSAPALILEASETRMISGTIFEDNVTNTEDNQKLGNGIFEQDEKRIQGVIVELYKVNNDGTIGEIAKYSNGLEAKVITGEDGKYTFGKYELNDDGSIKECYGVLPGRYIIKYTYNNQSYIVGKTNVNVKDYKSTIITSPVIKEAFEEQNEKWYLVEEKDADGNIINYSDARDKLSLRPEYNAGADVTITNLTYNNLLAIDKMEAYTPIMDIGVEFTQEDVAQALTFNRVEEFKNIDFGIIERPNIDMTLNKEITGLEITTSTGMNIVSMGTTSDLNHVLQGVKQLDGLVSAEVESDLLQGAKLTVEYTITVSNNSDKDYLEESYYYYGTGGITDISSKVKKVIDYTDATMELDTEKNQGNWAKVDNLEELYSEANGIGLVSREVYEALRTGEYHVLITEAFKDVAAGETKEAKLYATKSLSAAVDISEANRAEIIELSGIRTIKGSIPGNYVPRKVEAIEYVRELDQDRVDLIVTTPTGTTVNYILYIVAIMATLAILTIGIVVIKKKIVK